MSTTFIIPSVRRPTLKRATQSVKNHRYLVGYDDARVGEGEIRNRLIKQARTKWVSMLDDDDSVTADYVQRLEEEIKNHPEAEMIMFRAFFLSGHVMPLAPEIFWGNIGISFSIRRSVILKHPFKTEDHEDFEAVKRLDAAGVKIHFSKYLTYRVRH